MSEAVTTPTDEREVCAKFPISLPGDLNAFVREMLPEYGGNRSAVIQAALRVFKKSKANQNGHKARQKAALNARRAAR